MGRAACRLGERVRGAGCGWAGGERERKVRYGRGGREGKGDEAGQSRRGTGSGRAGLSWERGAAAGAGGGAAAGRADSAGTGRKRWGARGGAAAVAPRQTAAGVRGGVGISPPPPTPTPLGLAGEAVRGLRVASGGWDRREGNETGRCRKNTSRVPVCGRRLWVRAVGGSSARESRRFPPVLGVSGRAEWDTALPLSASFWALVEFRGLPELFLRRRSRGDVARSFLRVLTALLEVVECQKKALKLSSG